MSFYESTVQHPDVQVEYSGTALATGTISRLTEESHYAPQGVWLKNEDLIEGVRVSTLASPNGFLLSPNTSRFFPIYDTNRLMIQRAAFADAIVSYWVG